VDDQRRKDDDGSAPHRSCRCRRPTIRSETKKTKYQKPQHIREKVAYHDYRFKLTLAFLFFMRLWFEEVYFVWLNFTVYSCTSQIDELL
jgi:hypothetical protein